MLLHLSDNAASAPLRPHLAPGVCRCSAIALRFGGVLVFFVLPPSSRVANNETTKQASAHAFSSGWDRGHPFRLSPLLKISCSCGNYISVMFECPQMARTHRVALGAEEGVAASARRYAPSIPTCPCVLQATKGHERAVTSLANV
jgi:hypothetical protein